MALYYKFKSAKDFNLLAIDGCFISVGLLKEKLFESKHLGDFDLIVTNAQTNEEYVDEDILIPKNTSVLIRRVPGLGRMPIVTKPITHEPKFENMPENAQQARGGSDSSNRDDSEWDEFGNDIYTIPEVMPNLAFQPTNNLAFQPTNVVHDAPPLSKADEDSKIKALIETPALDWQCQASYGVGRGMGGRMMGGRGFGRGGAGLEQKTPPQGYTCHRCRVPGHFIQHCPTNGDPNFDIKRVKPPTGIPKSMLMATPDGSYVLPSGAVAVLKPNEAAFEKEIEGMPSTRSTRSVGDLPPELHCPLCKQVMKDAALTSKCCFASFCDKCIRDHIIAKSMCICGATNILADDLLPNITLRDTINRILESNNSSSEKGGSVFQVKDMESARCPPPKGEPMPMPLPHIEETAQVKEIPEVHKATNNAPSQSLGRDKVVKVADVSETIRGSMTVKEPAPQGGAPLADDILQQKPFSGEAGKKKKKKKSHLPFNAAEMHWKMSEENYMMSMGPYWNGMAPGMEAYMNPYANTVPYMGYGLGPSDVPYGGPDHPFAAQGFMMPSVRPPQRRELGKDREFNREGKDREFNREVSSAGGADVSFLKSKSKDKASTSSTTTHHDRPSSNKRKSDHESSGGEHYHHRTESSSAVASSKKRKQVPEAPVGAPPGSSGHYRTSSAGGYGYHEDYKPTSYVSRKTAVEYESSDDDRHFKRRRRPVAPAKAREETRHWRGPRERASASLLYLKA